ncbi:geranylgeranylglycerol-phosphate geranylgeranyltransferase [Flavobacterium beibuense]|uniref:geranylgeranylglycerol-phosphate geranylgeranyltransferase n=1 Tax=Flavobacterium beibuense TaxID=657326 RepID=UPI00101B739D|nr:geranylgeranylglycerol-phosphate geranylgeranyltransferase [Flavobacterium beibuense]
MKSARLIRYGNLLFLAFTFCAFRYGFLEQQQGLTLALNQLQFLMLVFSCVCIAAGGFLINNIIDGNSEINFGISEAKGYNLYAALNIVGVGIGFYLSNLIGKPGFALLFILIAATMYFYATNLKYTIVVNNLIIAFLVAISILVVGIYDLYPMITPENQKYLGTLFGIFIDFSIFTFVISFIREIVKNIRDVNKDYNEGINTLPIALGKERMAKAAFVLSLIPVGLLLYYANTYLINDKATLLYALIYLLLFVLGPLIYFMIGLWTAKTEKDFDRLSLVLKIVLAFAALSIVVITFNIQNNA